MCELALAPPGAILGVELVLGGGGLMGGLGRKVGEVVRPSVAIGGAFSVVLCFLMRPEFKLCTDA